MQKENSIVPGIVSTVLVSFLHSLDKGEVKISLKQVCCEINLNPFGGTRAGVRPKAVQPVSTY